MELFKKWYVILILCLVAAGVLVAVIIYFDQKEMGEVIDTQSVPGTQYATQQLIFQLNASDLTHVVDINPDIESGWGDPDVYMSVSMTAPNGVGLFEVNADELWGGVGDMDSSRSYNKRFTFIPEESGEYILQLTVLTEHVESVRIKIGQRPN